VRPYKLQRKSKCTLAIAGETEADIKRHRERADRLYRQFREGPAQGR
jgi:hypothetical protein